MAITGTSQLSNSVKPYYDRDYMLAAQPRIYWDQFTWKKMGFNGVRGSSVNFVIYENLNPATSTLSQAADVTPVAMSDTEVVVTLGEYGNVVQQTKFLKATAYTDVEQAAAEVVGYNMAESIDMVVRAVAGQGTFAVYATGVARSSQATTNKISYAFISRLTTLASGRKCPAFEDGKYVSIVHPNAEYDLLQDSVFLNVAAYQDKTKIYNGEIGTLGGVRFIITPLGKAFWGAGSQTVATTLSAAASAGDTTLTVTSGTSITNGDYVAVGTLETGNTWYDTTETVQVTAGGGTTTLTIQGEGNAQGNFGCRYAHANGVAVTDAANVYMIPIMGPHSVAKGWSNLTGEKGQIVISGPFDTLLRFKNVGWLMYAGWQRTSEKWVIRGECSGTY